VGHRKVTGSLYRSQCGGTLIQINPLDTETRVYILARPKAIHSTRHATFTRCEAESQVGELKSTEQLALDGDQPRWPDPARRIERRVALKKRPVVKVTRRCGGGAGPP